MRRGLDWYKREPRAWLDGVRAAKMTDRQAAIYGIVVDLIYDGAGETPDDPRHIASYLSNVGTAAARTAIQHLVDIGKIFRVGGMLHQNRAENEAKPRRKLSETRAEAGRLGGISSGKSRRDLNKINNLTEANASTKAEPEIEEEREKKEEAVVARALDRTEPPQTEWTVDKLYDEVIAAVGLRHGNLPTYWMPPAAPIHVWRWHTDLNLSPEAIIEGARQNRAQFTDAPGGPKALDRAMQRLSAALTAPPLSPETPPSNPRGPSHARQSERRAFDSAINRLADGLAAGTVKLDDSSRDPFADRRGG